MVNGKLNEQRRNIKKLKRAEYSSFKQGYKNRLNRYVNCDALRKAADTEDNEIRNHFCETLFTELTAENGNNYWIDNPHNEKSRPERALIAAFEQIGDHFGFDVKKNFQVTGNFPSHPSEREYTKKSDFALEQRSSEKIKCIFEVKSYGGNFNETSAAFTEFLFFDQNLEDRPDHYVMLSLNCGPIPIRVEDMLALSKESVEGSNEEISMLSFFVCGSGGIHNYFNNNGNGVNYDLMIQEKTSYIKDEIENIMNFMRATFGENV